MASVIEELNFKFYLILTNLNLKCVWWLPIGQHSSTFWVIEGGNFVFHFFMAST